MYLRYLLHQSMFIFKSEYLLCIYIYKNLNSHMVSQGPKNCNKHCISPLPFVLKVKWSYFYESFYSWFIYHREPIQTNLKSFLNSCPPWSSLWVKPCHTNGEALNLSTTTWLPHMAAKRMSGGIISKANVCCWDTNVICCTHIIQHTAGQK